jgi:hypothetical protein
MEIYDEILNLNPLSPHYNYSTILSTLNELLSDEYAEYEIKKKICDHLIKFKQSPTMNELTVNIVNEIVDIATSFIKKSDEVNKRYFNERAYHKMTRYHLLQICNCEFRQIYVTKDISMDNLILKMKEYDIKYDRKEKIRLDNLKKYKILSKLNNSDVNLLDKFIDRDTDVTRDLKYSSSDEDDPEDVADRTRRYYIEYLEARTHPAFR